MSVIIRSARLVPGGMRNTSRVGDTPSVTGSGAG
jgi:hypothetical protein